MTDSKKRRHKGLLNQFFRFSFRESFTSFQKIRVASSAVSLSYINTFDSKLSSKLRISMLAEPEIVNDSSIIRHLEWINPLQYK